MGLVRLWVAVLIIGLVAACGDDDAETVTGDSVPEGTEAEGEAVSNACPAEGCAVTIDDVVAEGDELVVTWSTNFDPDVSRNHIHVYWDTYTAEQVSSDAADRGVEQGDWVPTDEAPTYRTSEAVSVENRGDSTVLCVTAGDRDHAVLDASVYDCEDVGAVLP
jgi:hypothetical protein